jgi:hypothetical protein
MIRALHFSVFLSFLLTVASCTNTSSPQSITSKGEPGRLVLVADDALYAAIDSVLDDVFLEPQPWLPMDEAYFKPSRMNTQSFRRSFIEHQTVFFLVTRENFAALSAYIPNMDKEKMEALFAAKHFTPIALKNKFATPQMMYYLFAETPQEMAIKLTAQKTALLTQLYNKEVEDYALRLFDNKHKKNPLFKQIKKQLGMGVAVTNKFEKMKQEEDFFWFAERYVNEQLGVVCYRIPYTDTAQFSDAFLIAFRDSIMKEQIPGPQPGTYMSTSGSDLHPLLSEVLQINGQYAKKIRGWWTVKGEFMGGPFVQYAVLNKKGTHIFVYEGFVYAPNKSKSKNLRTLEAFGYTIQ